MDGEKAMKLQGLLVWSLGSPLWYSSKSLKEENTQSNKNKKLKKLRIKMICKIKIN
jgi:hypothetical protein